MIRRGQHLLGEHRLIGWSVIHPIIVHGDHVAVAVSKFEDRVGQRPGDAEVSQGRSDRTNDDGGVKTTLRAYNNATNQDVRIRPDEATRAQVTQLTHNRRIVQIIDLDQSHTGPTVLAADDRRVEAGIQSCDNGGLEGIGRIETVADDPVVVVCRDDGSGGVMQLQDSVADRPSDAEVGSKTVRSHE